MAFKKAINIVPIWNNKDLAENSVIEGKYISHETMEGKFGVQDKFVIETADGTFAIAGSASIVSQFVNVPEGSLVRVTYKGRETTKSGNTVKVFEVEYDDSAL